MTPARAALAAAEAAGVRVEARGDKLRLTAPAPPPPEVLHALAELKPELLVLLRGEPDLAALVEDTAARAHAATHPDLTPEEAAIEAEERAAIQGEAGLPPQTVPLVGLAAGLTRAARTEPREVGRIPDDPVIREHLASLSTGCYEAFTAGEGRKVERYTRAAPEAPWLGPLPVRAPSFHALATGWVEGREGWCTGCGQPSRWVADELPGRVGPRMRRWYCTRSTAHRGQGKPAA
ncbi:MAG: hypothetical protein ACREFP_14845 [Acetobacteraceae bacterium]